MNSGVNDLSTLEAAIGYRFNDKSLLKEALSHSSYVNELKIHRTGCYERLEFLGDAVLELVSSEYLFDRYTNDREGELSKHRAALVCEQALSACARRIQLGSYILLGRGEARQNGADKDSILCDVIEAVIGAMYKDGGMEPPRRFITDVILSDDEEGCFTDSKTALQELVQTGGSSQPVYDTQPVDGEEQRFFSRVLINGEVMGTGYGSGKKEAEKIAAAMALNKLKD